jgi:hypothetical protein
MLSPNHCGISTAPITAAANMRGLIFSQEGLSKTGKISSGRGEKEERWTAGHRGICDVAYVCGKLH